MTFFFATDGRFSTVRTPRTVDKAHAGRRNVGRGGRRRGGRGDVPMDLSTLAAMPVPSPMRPSMICSSRRRRRGQNASRSAGRPRGGRTATGLDLKTRTIAARHRRRGGAKGGAGGASAYLLGADEVVAEAASLLLREHHDLDGFLGETLRRWTGRGEEGSGRKPRRPRHDAHVRESGFSRPGAPRRGARPRGREPPEPDRGGAVARSVSEPTGRAKPPAIPGRLVSERAVVARAG